MRTALIAAGLLALASPAFAADPVEGVWVPPDGGSKITVAPCAGAPTQMCGKISWLPAAVSKNLDTNNPKAELKKRPVLGLQTFSGFKSTAPGKWTGGKLYDPSSGKTYSGKLTGAGNTLKVEGCVLGICQAQTWKRG